GGLGGVWESPGIRLGIGMNSVKRMFLLNVGENWGIIPRKYGNFWAMRGIVRGVNVNSPREVVPKVDCPFFISGVQFTGGTYSGRRSGHSQAGCPGLCSTTRDRIGSERPGNRMGRGLRFADQ